MSLAHESVQATRIVTTQANSCLVNGTALLTFVVVIRKRRGVEGRVDVSMAVVLLTGCALLQSTCAATFNVICECSKASSSSYECSGLTGASAKFIQLAKIRSKRSHLTVGNGLENILEMNFALLFNFCKFPLGVNVFH